MRNSPNRIAARGRKYFTGLTSYEFDPGENDFNIYTLDEINGQTANYLF
jgi:hypothetical protein